MLQQAEADALIAMRKTFLNPSMISLPAGSDLSYDLEAIGARERFLLDLYRGTFRLSKLKFQTRGRSVIVLVRIDLDSSPHTNPDGTKVGVNHIHLYREGYDDKWAYPLNDDRFSSIFTNPTDIEATFKQFCGYCSITGSIPAFQRDLL